MNTDPFDNSVEKAYYVPSNSPEKFTGQVGNADSRLYEVQLEVPNPSTNNPTADAELNARKDAELRQSKDI